MNILALLKHFCSHVPEDVFMIISVVRMQHEACFLLCVLAVTSCYHAALEETEPCSVSWMGLPFSSQQMVVASQSQNLMVVVRLNM